MARRLLVLLGIALIRCGCADLADNFTLKTEKEIAASGWPYLPDYRDPNSAWTLSDKVVFFLLYSACWLGVIASVHLCTRPRSRKIVAADPPDEELGSFGSPAFSASGPTPSYPDKQLIHELILEQAQQSAASTALIIPSQRVQRISYAELHAAVHELAKSLQRLGLEPGHIAALCMERSCAQVVAVLGVLATGGGYLPIDATAPDIRVAELLKHSHATVLLADNGERDAGFAQLAKEAAVPLLVPWKGEPTAMSFELSSGGSAPVLQTPAVATVPKTSEVAMLIYTSGTSGAPKGIIYDHRHLLHGAWFWAEEHSMTERSVQLLKSPYFWAVMEWEAWLCMLPVCKCSHSIISTRPLGTPDLQQDSIPLSCCQLGCTRSEEFFPALLRGGSLVVASSDGHKSPEYMARVIHQQRVSVLMITPSAPGFSEVNAFVLFKHHL